MIINKTLGRALWWEEAFPPRERGNTTDIFQHPGQFYLLNGKPNFSKFKASGLTTVSILEIFHTSFEVLH